MSLLMAFNSNSNYQSSNGRYQGVGINGGAKPYIWVIDTNNGKIVSRYNFPSNSGSPIKKSY